MKTLSSILLEKLRINKDTEIQLSKDEVDERNAELLENFVKEIKEFLDKYVGEEGEDYEIKTTSLKDIRIYIYSSDKKSIEDKLYKEGFGKKSWIDTTNYGFRIRPMGYLIHRSDFDKKTFKHR